MKLERTRNASRNVAYGIVLKLYQIVIPFLLRTIMIYTMGVQYLGLNGLFASILQVLNLAELGVGDAMVYAMYRPIVNDDEHTICALMKLYRTYYRVIGVVIGVMGLILTPFVPSLIKSDLPAELNIYVLYLLSLATTVLSYWMYAYKNSLLVAHQRNDVVSKVNLLTSTVQYVLQILVLVFVRNYYYYLIVKLATQAMTNLLTAKAAGKMYPTYRPEGKLRPDMIKDINHRIRDLFTAKFGGVVIHAFDTIVISAFLGLSVLAIYQNYNFVLSSVTSLVSIIFHACLAGIGNSIVVETKEKNFQDFKKFTFIICWILGICTCCLLCLYQPFMRVWVGENLMLKYSAVICFCVYFFVYEIGRLLDTYKDAAGIWHQDRFRPLVTAVVNLALNVILVNYLGIYGIILATIISILFIGMPWVLRNLFTALFDRKYLAVYCVLLLRYAVTTILVCGLCWWICSFVVLSDWLTLILRVVVCLIVPNAVFLILYYKKEEFAQSVELLDKITKHKLNLRKYLGQRRDS